MSKKGKRVVFDSTPNCSVRPYEDAKTRLKHQNLIQDFEELQRESDAIRSRLEAANMRKSNLAAEVRFMRKRYKQLMKSKNMDSLQEQAHLQMKNRLKQAKIPKEPFFIRKEASEHILHSFPQPKSKKQSVVRQSVLSNAFPATTDQSRKKISQGGKRAAKCSPNMVSTLVSNLTQKEKKRTKKEGVAPNMTLLYDRKQDEKIPSANYMGFKDLTATFDLNEDSCPNGKEASFPDRSQIFDLNEISRGDEDLDGETASHAEAKKSLIRGINNKQQKDLKLAVCRNSGEGSSRVGKRKISWHDPVALRV